MYSEETMPNHFTNIKIKNYRSLAEIDLKLGSLNLFFGPNGVGKTTVLDAPWFIRGCSAQGLQTTVRERNYGRDLLWANAANDSTIEIQLSTSHLEYLIQCGFASGKQLPFPGEHLRLRNAPLLHNRLILRNIDDSSAQVRAHINRKKTAEELLRDKGSPTIVDPQWATTGIQDDRLVLGNVIGLLDNEDATSLSKLIFTLRRCNCRSFKLHEVRRIGSEVTSDLKLSPLAENVWSALRNLRDRKDVGDLRYDTILKYFKEAFPEITTIRTEQTSPTLVYAYFKEQGLDRELPAFGMSEGMLQFICILVALFGDPLDQPTVMLFDEPEISLHPWPLQVLAQAMRHATESYQRQILIATHSPTLMSAFDASDCFVVNKTKGQTTIRPVLDDQEVKELLDQYSLGSLYLNESVAPQNPALINGVAQ